MSNRTINILLTVLMVIGGGLILLMVFGYLIFIMWG